MEDLAKMVGEHPLSAELAALLLATERLPRFRDTFLRTLSSVIHLGGNRAGVRLTAEQLAQIPQPTLVIWGEHDPFGSVATGERMVAALPRGEFQTVPAGHAPWLRHGEEIARRIAEFLRRVAES